MRQDRRFGDVPAAIGLRIIGVTFSDTGDGRAPVVVR
jgi:hypothetical protein